MIFYQLKEELLQSLCRCFPAAKVDIKERRSVILELRAYIDKATFIEVYANSITGKKSFALISEGKRITGYDNYRFWHHHPPDKPDDHIPCAEPTVDLVLSFFKDILIKRLLPPDGLG